MTLKWLPCMNVEMGSCHANLILLQGKPVSRVLIADVFFFLGGNQLTDIIQIEINIIQYSDRGDLH